MHSNSEVVATIEGRRIYVKTPFALKDVAKTILGHTWDAASKRWHYPATPSAAAAIRKAYEACAPTVNGISVDRGVLELLAQAELANEGAKLKHAEDLPRIPGRYCECASPTPGDPTREENPYMCMMCDRAIDDMLHQRQAYAFLKDRSGFAGMGMGTGKTKLYFALLDGSDTDFALVVTTKKGRRVFPKQARIHSERNWLVYNGVRNRKGELKKTAPLSDYVAGIEQARQMAAVQGRPFMVVVHYDVIWRTPMNEYLKDYLRANDVKVIYDESHRIKSPGGRASKAADVFEKYATQVWGGTGSFMAHSKLDVYAQARAVDKGVFGTSFAKFRNRFCIMGGYEDREIIGWQNEDLFNEMVDSFAFMVDTDDVLDLPPVSDEIREIELDAEAMKLIRQLENDFYAEVENGVITADNALTKLLRQQQATSGHASLDAEDSSDERTVIEIDRSKRDDLADILADLPPHEKVVVFARFTHDLNGIREVVEASGRAYGEVSGQREDLTSDGTMPDDIDVLGVQIQSGSEAVDFTAARYCIYYSLGFSLKDYEQSRRRVHRPGQTRPVTYYHLIAKGTVDEKVYSALANRKAVIQQVIDYVKGEKIVNEMSDLERAAMNDALAMAGF